MNIFSELMYCSWLSVFSDKTVVNRYLLSVLARLFLEKLEQSILKFVADFARLTVSDEKVSAFHWLMVFLFGHMLQGIFWNCRF